MTSDDLSRFAADHVASFNAAVASGSFDAFLDRFSDQAVVRFENVPRAGTLEFAGDLAIAEAYRTQPPDDQIELDGTVERSGDDVMIPFVWRRDRSPGLMRLRVEHGLIRRMTVIFG